MSRARAPAAGHVHWEVRLVWGHVSGLMPRVSCLMPRVSCLMPRVSYLMPRVSCPTAAGHVHWEVRVVRRPRIWRLLAACAGRG